MKKRWMICMVPILASFLSVKEKETQANFIHRLLSEDTSKVIHKVIERPEKFRLQIAYTQLRRDKEGKVKLKTYTYRTDNNEYFYPASMVKLPVAALALEKIRSLGNTDINFDSLILKTIDPVKGTVTQSSIKDKIQKLFVVSNNSVFNDLHDFVGQEKINRRLWEMGYKDSRVIQKFLATDSIGHRSSYAVQLYSSAKGVIYERGLELNPNSWKNQAGNYLVGNANYDGGKLIRKPKDFSSNNYLPLSNLHEILISLIYPDAVSEQKRFNLKEADYRFLRKYMSMYPREAGVSEWMDSTIYYDSFRKYLLKGTSKNPIDSCLKIYNKVGQAYGFLTDCAYIVDYKNDIEFFLSATIYVNEDEVINDGRYEYEKTGMPFLTRLGEIFYKYESARPREQLSRVCE